jgi:MFS family permease
MARNRLYRILSRIVEIRPGEELVVLSLFIYLFLLTAPFAIIKPIRNANFLEKLSAFKLPFAYLLTAILLGFIVSLHSKLQVNIRRSILIIFSLIFFIVTCFFFWLEMLFPLNWRWTPLIFWIWANIFITVLVTQFWMVVNDLLNPREAKRLIGFFVSGGILGGILGGTLAGFLAKFGLIKTLLPIVCLMLISCVLVVRYIFIWQKKRISALEKGERIKKSRDTQEESKKVGFKVCFRTVRKSDYLTLLAVISAITLIVSTLIDFQFNSVVENKLTGLENRVSFFGFFNSGANVFAFLFQLLMTSSLIKRYGIRFTLLLFPLILFVCSSGILFFQTIALAITIKGSDKSLSYSINQSLRELLYIPVSPEFKYKAKIFIDMFLNKIADGLGALILVAIIHLSRREVQFVSVVSAIFIIAWIILSLRVSREYTNTVKQSLEMKWQRADRLVADKLDMDYTKLVFDTLESKNRSSVLYAMHLFDLIKGDKLTPEVRKLISYKSDEVKMSSLGALLEGKATILVPEIDDKIGEEDLEKDIKEIMSLDVYQEVMKSHFDRVMSDQSKEAETVKMEVAKALGLMNSHSPLVAKLEELLQDPSPEVSKYAVESAAKLKKREYVHALVSKLNNPLIREDAGDALEKYGPRIAGTLADYLADAEEGIVLRREVASVLGRIGNQDAADFLCWALAEDTEEMDNEIIDALDRIRSEKTDIEFSEAIVKSKTMREILKYCQTFIEPYEAESFGKKRKTREGLSRTLSFSLMNIFKLLGLIYSREDISKAYQNIRTGTKNSVAYAVELLDNTLKKEIRDVFLPLVEDLSPEEKAKRCREIIRALSEPKTEK